MTLLVAADIFGATPELAALAAALPGTATIVSPYAGAQPEFAREEDAYAAFIAQGGIDAYAARLAQAIGATRPQALVGFSAGATAAWVALASCGAAVALAVLFYGSRIRDFAGLTPACPVKLIFAEHEKSVDAAKLAARLRRPGVDAEIVPGTRHGFMNARSPGYDPAALQAAIRKVAEMLAALPRPGG